MVTPHSLLPPAPDNHCSFCLYDLTVLGISYTWNHTVFVLLPLAYFSSIMFSGLICVIACVRLSPLKAA